MQLVLPAPMANRYYPVNYIKTTVSSHTEQKGGLVLCTCLRLFSLGENAVNILLYQ